MRKIAFPLLAVVWILAPISPAAAVTPAPVVVIVMENRSFGPNDPGVNGDAGKYIVGNPNAPYINGSLIPQGTLFSNYDAIGADSLPNYLDMTAGTDGGCSTNACSPNSIGADNLFQVLGHAGISFDSFAQSMPSNCDLATSAPYVPKHNPEVYFTNVDAASLLSYGCNVTDVPFPGSWPDPLPSLSFVVPDNCHNMHGTSSTGPCPLAKAQLTIDGDNWLSQNVPAFVARGATVIVTFDEGAPTDTTGGGGHVATVMVGPNVSAGSTDSTAFSHFGLFAGLEDYFGVSPLLGGAATATPLPIPPPTPLPVPTIGGFSPTTDPAGQTVTITGTAFTNAYAVRFNGALATFTIQSDTTITATVPPSATNGPISVSTGGGTASSTTEFIVQRPPAPTISSFAPTTGGPGDPVTINGTGFTSASSVTFGGAAASYTVGDDMTIHAVVPARCEHRPDLGYHAGRNGDECRYVHGLARDRAHPRSAHARQG